MTEHEFKRGQEVRYDNGDAEVAANILRLHRDGTVTIRATFFYKKGQMIPGYLGFEYRVSPDGLRVSS